MDAPTAIHAAAWPDAAAPIDAARLARGIVFWLFALLAVAALVVCARRVGEALVEPLPFEFLWGWAALLALAAIAFRRVWPRDVGGHALQVFTLWSFPSITLVLWAAALSLRETSTAGLVGLWGIIAVEEAWSWGRSWSGGARHKIASSAAPTSAAPIGAIATSVAIEAPADAQDEATWQHVVRRRNDDGSETIEGWLRAAFAPQQRHASAHLAICPPMVRVPECFAEPADGPAAEVKVAQVLPYGVRFEIKLDAPAAEPTSVLVEFAVHERAGK